MKARYRISRSLPVGVFALTFFTLALVGCGSDSDDESAPSTGGMPSVTKTAILTGLQETPSVATSATGYTSLDVDPDTLIISGGVSFTGVTATAAHIHTGAAGVSGAPAITLTVDNDNHSATVPDGTVLSQQQYDDLMAGNLYVNVHSAANPGGEIRGQIGRFVMTAMLNGAQETSAVMTDGTGTGMVVVDPVTLAISGEITFSDVTATAAHIHTGAAGASGAVAVGLTVGVDGMSATVPNSTVLSQQQYDDLVAGNLYFNVHSATNPSGDIRGQIGPVVMVAMLDGMQEYPTPVTTAATGQGMVVVDPVTLAISGGITFSNVTATAAHIHTGAAGANGAVAVALTVGADGMSATVPDSTVLSQQQYDDLVAGNLYLNVHSATNASGEIRGQLGQP